MTNEPKGRVVGFDRPGMQFPEDVSEFFPGFLMDKLAVRSLGQPISPALIESIRAEALQMMAIATDIYRLPILVPVTEFWSVDVKSDGLNNEVTINIVPTELKACTMDLNEGDDSVRLAIVESPWLDEVGLFIVAPSTLQAFIGLARMIEARRKRG